MWHIKVPASTANLGSGFDALGMALALPLECWFSKDSELHIEVRGEGEGIVPESEKNLVWHTANTLHQELAGEPMPKGHLTIRSRIPLARGLGSSAAAIVAGLMLANTFLPKRLTQDQLLACATKIEGHPDNVAAAIYGGFVLAWADGSQVHVKNYPAPDLRCLLVVPDYKVSTEDARQVLPASIPMADAIFNAQRLALWVDAINRREWSLLKYAGQDRLHQPYRQSLVPGMQALIDTALASGAVFAALSGSGPTIVALMPQDRVMTVTHALKDCALTDVPAPVTLHDITPSYFGAQCILDGWQWHHGERMGFNTRPKTQIVHTICHSVQA